MAKPAPRTITFAVYGPLHRDDIPGLCARICRLFERETPVVAFCNVVGVDSDAVAVDALARLQHAAQRHGCSVRVRDASGELLDLVAFIGLEDVVSA